MENTLFANDVIFVNKLKYGPLFPQSLSEVPLINIIYMFKKGSKDFTIVKNCKNTRLSGTGILKNGDVVVFTMPFRSNFHIVKRCIGIGGDTLQIKMGEVYLNKVLFKPSPLIQNVSKDNKSIQANSFEKGITKNHLENEGCLPVQASEEADISQIILFSKIKKNTLTTKQLYPQLKNKNWSLDEYGPIVIPKKGMKIKLNSKNYELYHKVISAFECVVITENLSSYYINGIEIKSYTFKQNYYFMMGDNRKESMDSRFWGFVPENRIIGKVPFVLFSNSKEEFRWDRIFKSVE